MLIHEHENIQRRLWLSESGDATLHVVIRNNSGSGTAKGGTALLQINYTYFLRHMSQFGGTAKQSVATRAALSPTTPARVWHSAVPLAVWWWRGAFPEDLLVLWLLSTTPTLSYSDLATKWFPRSNLRRLCVYTWSKVSVPALDFTNILLSSSLCCVSQ